MHNACTFWAMIYHTHARYLSGWISFDFSFLLLLIKETTKRKKSIFPFGSCTTHCVIATQRFIFIVCKNVAMFQLKLVAYKNVARFSSLNPSSVGFSQEQKHSSIKMFKHKVYELQLMLVCIYIVYQRVFDRCNKQPHI